MAITHASASEAECTPKSSLCQVHTSRQNMINVNARKLSTSPSPLKGAYYQGAHNNTRPWFSQIRVNGKAQRLGSFRTAREAHEAYCKAAKQHHGEFARTTSKPPQAQSRLQRPPKPSLEDRVHSAMVGRNPARLKRAYGVRKHPLTGRFECYVTVCRRYIHIGTFATEAQAGKAYKKARNMVERAVKQRSERGDAS